MVREGGGREVGVWVVGGGRGSTKAIVSSSNPCSTELIFVSFQAKFYIFQRISFVVVLSLFRWNYLIAGFQCHAIQNRSK